MNVGNSWQNAQSNHYQDPNAYYQNDLSSSQMIDHSYNSVQQPKSLYQGAFGSVQQQSHNNNMMVNSSVIGIQRSNTNQNSQVNSSMNLADAQMAQNARHFGFVPSNNRNLFSREYFKCECGFEIPMKDIRTHSTQCFQMSSKYQGLFVCLGHELIECNNDTQKLKNLKIVLSSFVEQINEKIKCNNVPSGLPSHRQSNMVPLEKFQMNESFHQANQQQRQDSSRNLSNYSSQIQSVDSRKRSSIGIRDVMMNEEYNNGGQNSNRVLENSLSKEELKEEESFMENSAFEKIEPVQQEDPCSYCGKAFTKQEMQENQKRMILSTECYHSIHVQCMIDMIFEKFPSSQIAQCPQKGCGKSIQEWEFKEYMKPEQIEKLDELVSKAILNQGLNVVVCKCGNVMELEEGQIDLNQKDDKGNKISREAAKHMAKYRVRCTCGKNFCCLCKEEPYHLGETCEQFQNRKSQRSCRFCQQIIAKGVPLQSSKQAFKDVCNSQECIDAMKGSCDKILECGHYCCGFVKEKKCLPCLHPDCVAKKPQLTFDQNADSYCNICYVSGLGQEPCLKLDCGHIFHIRCIKTILTKRWPGPRIVLNYLNCTQCKRRMSANYCPEIKQILNEAQIFEDDIRKKAIERGKHEGLDKHENLKDPGYAYFNKFQDYCLFKLAYYECFKCKLPYFGGMKDCQNNQEEQKQNEGYKKEDLVCAKCSAVGVGGGVLDCPKHGMDYIEFKCKFCCNTAQWFCWGNTHFCESCHKRQNEGDYVSRKKRSELPKCPGIDKCPLKLKHPENGEEFPLGCALCRNMKDNMKNF